MNVVLIPYFLAANIAVDDTQPWPYGPEFTYRGVFNAASERSHDENLKIYLDYELKCRNHNESSLICRTSDLAMRSSDTTLEEDVDYIRQELSSPFLITFNENGVESVSISNDRLEPLMQLFQYVASLFHVGVDLRNKPNPSIFTTRESSVMGDCDTSFSVSTRTVPDTISNEISRKNNYSLYVIPYADQSLDTAIEIDKVKDPKTCTVANQGDSNNVLMTSKSQIYVANAGIFKSDIKDAGKTIRQKAKKVSTKTYRQHLSLELVNIEKASACFITFSYVKTAGLEIEDDDSFSSSSSSSSSSDSDSDSDSKSDELFSI